MKPARVTECILPVMMHRDLSLLCFWSSRGKISFSFSHYFLWWILGLRSFVDMKNITRLRKNSLLSSNMTQSLMLTFWLTAPFVMKSKGSKIVLTCRTPHLKGFRNHNRSQWNLNADPWNTATVLLSNWREETITCPDGALSLAAGIPNDDSLRRMAEDIVTVVIRELIDEIDHLVFDEEQ